MPYVPDNAVVRRVEDIMQGNGQFYRPQGSSQMSWVIGDDPDNEFPQLVGHLRELGGLQFSQVLGGIDMV